MRRGWSFANGDLETSAARPLELAEKAEAVFLRLSAAHLKEIRDMAPELITILKRLLTEMT